MAANPRISARERGLLKGAIRRVFSRSDLRKEAIEKTRVEYHDPMRPRVSKWSVCPTCGKLEPSYKMEVDHIDPIIPVDTTLEQMSWDDVVNRVWCEAANLKGICKTCHKEKTKLENRERRKKKLR